MTDKDGWREAVLLFIVVAITILLLALWPDCRNRLEESGGSPARSIK